MPDPDITLVNVYSCLRHGEAPAPEVYLPLGCLYLIAALRDAGIRVEFRDYQIFSQGLSFPLDLGHFEKFLEDSAPIVGVSCMVSMLPFVLLGTKRFKEKHPEQKIILGGPGPSGTPDAIISHLPWVDVVVRGEGEATLVEVMQALTNGGDLSPIRGITYRDREAVHRNASRPRLRDLDRLSFPAYDAVDVSKYTNVSVITGRGCPFKCAFCDVGPLWENKVFLRSVDNVLAEIALLCRHHDLNRVNLVDDTFTLQRARTQEICRGIAGLDITWSCLSRIDVLDEDLLVTMAKAGCDSIFLGIESGSNTVLEKINKRFTIQEATHKVDMAASHMDRVITSFMWGFPFESMDDFKLTLFSIVSMWYLKAMTGLMLLSPMPLSKLGIEYRDQIDFSEELCSVFASLGNVTPGMKRKRAELPDEFKTVIRNYPDIFEGFYYIKSDSILDKASYLEGFCRRFGIDAE